KQVILAWIAVGAIVAGAAIRIETWRAASRPIVLTGTVLRAEDDPKKQAPIANVTVTAADSTESQTTKSDSSGFFKLTVHPGLLTRRQVMLRFEHAEYQPLEFPASDIDLLYVARLEPRVRDAVNGPPEAAAKITAIKNVRVRYSLKAQTTINVG